MKTFSLAVAEPCHERWEDLTPEAKGRFCGACKKTVVDFSLMTDRELAAYFSRNKGSLCGRFHSDQLDRQIVFPPKQFPWLRPFVPVALSAMTLLLEACTPQNEIKGEVAVTENIVSNTIEVEAAPAIVTEQGLIQPADTSKPLKKGLDPQVVTDKRKNRHPEFFPSVTVQLPLSDTIAKPVEQMDTTDQRLLRPRKEAYLMGKVTYTYYKALEEKKKRALAVKEAQEKARSENL
ncbi:hypothetical protein HRG84_06435 [Flavisolibacter sp. BT320]|nr:hypothetical protein [Flavisolibacter longurius]